MNEEKLILELGVKEYAKRVMRDVKGLISIAVVFTQNGDILAYDSVDSSVDNRVSGQYQVGVIRSAVTALESFGGLEDKNIKEITINYDCQNHILLLSESRKFLSHAILDKSANSTLVKKIMFQHLMDVTRELAARLGSRDFTKQIDIKF